MSLVTSDGESIAGVGTGYVELRVIFDGQSMNLVPGDGYGGYTDPSTAMPAQCMEGSGVPYQVVAINGQAWFTLAETAATRLHPWARTAELTVLMLTGGTASILAGLTAPQIYTNVTAYADAGRAAGFDLVVCATVPPANLLGHFDVAEEAVRNALNATVMANADDDFDAVVDVHSDPLDDPLDTTYYQADRTHWTPTAASIAGDRMRTALDTLI